MMRILLACPLHIVSPKLYAKAMAAMMKQSVADPYEICYGVSNDAYDAAVDRLGKLERARQMAIAGGYDALAVVGHDVELPTDALQRLLDANEPIACGVSVSTKWPHAWQTGLEGGCVLYRADVLHDNGWLCRNNIHVVDDLYCGRLSMEDGGKAIYPDPDEPNRIRIDYFTPQKAPATVPYTRTLLAQELAG